MEQQYNTAVLNDTAGVLPMDTDVIVNGVHDADENHPPSSINAGVKKGRGRPPKSAGSTKEIKILDTPKRARGRPPKIVETPSTTKKVAVPAPKQEEAPINGDASKKKRGRPSKGNTSNEQINGISKPQVQPAPVVKPQKQEIVAESTKKKRGRPSSATPKKAVVPVTPPAPQEAPSTKKRGRPSGSAGVAKPLPKPKVATSNDGAAKKRGRPKKAAASPTAVVATTPVNESTATVTANNVQ
jgi:hypothetical protein